MIGDATGDRSSSSRVCLSYRHSVMMYNLLLAGKRAAVANCNSASSAMDYHHSLLDIPFFSRRFLFHPSFVVAIVVRFGDENERP